MSLFHSLEANVLSTWLGIGSIAAIMWGIERIFSRNAISLESQLRSLQYWLFAGLGTGIALTLYGWIAEALQPRPLVVIPLRTWLGAPSLHWTMVILGPLLAVILYDFFDYWMHRAQHRWFWRLHAVHHSIEELSGINSYFHWTEQFFRIAFISLPAAYLVGIDGVATVFLAELLVRLQGYYLHSPTKLHVGPVLRRVIADNRFHRIHHSVHAEHFDKNFGAGTTIWDQLFGTAYFPAENEWPETGIVEQPETSSLREYLWGPFRGWLPTVSPVRSTEDLCRLGLLACALLANVVPIYRFIGSMIWFHHYLGDYQVFWGITKVPLGNIYDHRVFAYPPTALMLLSPFGLLPFWPSLVAWSIVGVAAMTCAASRIMRPLAITIGFITFAGIGVVLGGQISLFIGALIIAGLSAPPRWRGTLLAAAAVIKPQSLLAAPIVLIAERNWRAIGWAIAVACGLLVLSVIFFGLDPWLRWLTELPRFHAYLITHGIDRMDVGIYGLARSFGLPGWTFLFAAPLGLATSWLVFRDRSATTLDRYAAFAASTVLMSPYTLYYDLAGLTFACVAMLFDRERSPLIWLAAAMIVSSVFASFGIVLLAAMLSHESLRSSGSRAAGVEPERPFQQWRYS